MSMDDGGSSCNISEVELTNEFNIFQKAYGLKLAATTG
jgi:hypothetical protein